MIDRRETSFALILVAGFAMLLLAAKPYRVATDSMRPTLLAGDYAFLTRTSGTLRRGDIVSFRPPAGPNTRGVFVKRIVGRIFLLPMSGVCLVTT